MFKRTDIKNNFCNLLIALGADKLFRRINEKNLIVLAYHGITKAELPYNCWWQKSSVEFETEMEFLAAHYNIISLSDAVKHILSGEDFPANSAVITFDDGYMNNAVVALPILEKYGFCASFFVTPLGLYGKTFWPDKLYMISFFPKDGVVRIPFMNESLFITGAEEKRNLFLRLLNHFKSVDEERRKIEFADFEAVNETDAPIFVREEFRLLDEEALKRLGGHNLIEIGFHGNTHAILTAVNDGNSLLGEILDPVKIFEEKGIMTKKIFSYPNGNYDDNIIAALHDNGFAGAVTVARGVNSVSADPFKLKRFSIGAGISFDMFKLLISGFGGRYI